MLFNLHFFIVCFMLLKKLFSQKIVSVFTLQSWTHVHAVFNKQFCPENVFFYFFILISNRRYLSNFGIADLQNRRKDGINWIGLGNFSDYDPQVVEQTELQQPTCIPLSYALRFLTDAARKEASKPVIQGRLSQTNALAASTRNRNNAATTPTGKSFAVPGIRRYPSARVIFGKC